MSSDEIAIRVRDVAKHYLMFARPEDRLKQMVVPRLQRLAGRTPTRYYRDFAALNGVSFDIGRGETVGIIGRNGSGKSTLLQIVCGTLRPTRGTVEVNGRIAALLELGAGFNPEFTGRENVYLNATILGLSQAEIDDRFDAIAGFADIGDFIEQPVKTYSSGMYVRLAFATAINVDPDILVVDEALAVGDEAFQRKCFARIEQIKERGGTILFVSHGAQTIVQLCTRAVLFDGGELLLEGRPKMVTSQYQRLVNASPEAAREIRAAIVAMRDRPPVAPVPAATPPGRDYAGLANGENPEIGPPVEAPAKELDGRADYFDPSLKSQSAVNLEERGARIRDVRIATLKGDPVNVLQMGRRYIFEYFVEFAIDADHVGFGMLITDLKGLGLAGALTQNSRIYRLRHVAADTCVHVAFEFACSLVPGTYFVSAGAHGVVGGQQAILHRLGDILVFRIGSEPDYFAVGRVSMDTIPRITLVSPHAVNDDRRGV